MFFISLLVIGFNSTNTYQFQLILYVRRTELFEKLVLPTRHFKELASDVKIIKGSNGD